MGWGVMGLRGRCLALAHGYFPTREVAAPVCQDNPDAVTRHQPATREEVEGHKRIAEGSDVKKRLEGRDGSTWGPWPRGLLLVGEGNFSFAVALGETLNPNTSPNRHLSPALSGPGRDLVARGRHIQRLRERV